MNSQIYYYLATQRHADAIREARRNQVLARPPRPLDDADQQPGRLAAALRHLTPSRLTRPHALRTEPNRR